MKKGRFKRGNHRKKNIQKGIQKEILTISVFLFLMIITISIVSIAQTTCEYDARYDKDRDYVMNPARDCEGSYQYDCDDDNPDVYKECRNGIFQKLIDFFRGDGARVTGNAALEKQQPQQGIIERLGITKTDYSNYDSVCSTIICMSRKLQEVYCPLSPEECDEKYIQCRIVSCENEVCDEQKGEKGSDKDVYYQEEYTYEYQETEESSNCPLDIEYHDCYDDGEAVLCKGEFESCAQTFQNCVCGTSDSTGYDVAEAEIDTEQNIECDTGVYVCKRQTLTIDGNIAESKVTCKGTFPECAMMYGDCQCGEATLTEFPTQYIGDAGAAQESADGKSAEECAEEAYWCDFKEYRVPCHMLVEDCRKGQNTCFAGDKKEICQGGIDYCNKVYNDNCVCGLEAAG